MGTWWLKHKELEAEQKDVLSLPITQDHLVKGPPGSGKTNLLLLRARQLIGSYPHVVVVVHTRVLTEFMKSGATQYGVPPDKVVTFHELAVQIIRKSGGSISLPDDYRTRRAVLLQAIRECLESGRVERKFDCVLIDEAQDFSPEEHEVLRALGERRFAVADAQQKIYAGQNCIPQLESEMNTVVLTKHHRNGLRICQVADALALPGSPSLLTSSRYDEKGARSSVTAVGGLSIESQLAALAENISTQLTAYPGEMIGVVAPRAADVRAIAGFLRNSSFADLLIVQDSQEGYEEFVPDRTICLCTLHSAKGLEFRALNIIAAEKLSGMSNEQRLAYMGVTRGKTSLIVYHDGALPGYLDAAIRCIDPPKGLLSIEEILPDDDDNGGQI